VSTDSSPSRRRSDDHGESASRAAAGGRVEIVLVAPCRHPDVRRRELRPWLSEVLRELAPQAASFAVRFTSDREMRRVNYRFRGKDTATDVLSFPGGASPEGSHLGDVLVAIPTARRQAAAAGHPLAKELRILLLHGVLHCLGYDHETDDGAMERLEARLRRKWIRP
jgi:probable rRNA maturation factor